MGVSFYRFKSKVIALGVGAALVPMLILGILSYQSQKRIINDEFNVLLSSLVSESAEQISRWLAERRGEVDMLVRTPNLRDETARLNLSIPSQDDAAGARYRVRLSLLRQTLELIVLGYRWVIEASIVDPRTGRVLISTNDARHSNPVIGPSDLERIAKGGTVLSPVYASPEPFANDAGQLEQGMPTMSIAAPILLDGLMPGILNLRLDVQAMKKEFFGGTRFFAASGLRSLDLYLVNGDGVFLSSSAFEGALLAEGRIRRRSVLELAARVPQTQVPTEAVRACRGLHAGDASPASNLDGYIGYRGIPVVGTWVPVSGTDWCVIAEVERAETLAPVTHLLQITLFVFLGIGGIFALLAVWLSSTLTTPLIRLTALATRMAGGDRSVRFGMTRTDEIGQLAASFDQMAATIEWAIVNFSSASSARITRCGVMRLRFIRAGSGPHD